MLSKTNDIGTVPLRRNIDSVALCMWNVALETSGELRSSSLNQLV